MIAILQYGLFNTTINIREVSDVIHVLKPQEALTLYNLNFKEVREAVSAPKPKQILQFRYVNQLNEDYVLYEFDAEK